MGTNCALLADSHTEVIFGVRKLLEPLFDAIFMVADETSLVAALEKTGPDLTSVDLSMRSMQEPNIARGINKGFTHIKLIISSVHDEPVAAKECLEAGTEDFVHKRRVV